MYTENILLILTSQEVPLLATKTNRQTKKQNKTKNKTKQNKTKKKKEPFANTTNW